MSLNNLQLVRLVSEVVVFYNAVSTVARCVLEDEILCGFTTMYYYIMGRPASPKLPVNDSKKKKN